MLGNFPPFTTMQELNLDWILTKIKNILRFVPDDGSVGQILRRTAHGAEWSNEQGGGGAVNSVNGQTGTVVLTASDVGAISDTTPIPANTSDLNNDSGFVDAAGAAAAAPVQSVNGQTGTVVLTASDVSAMPDNYVAPVTSVNGQTGVVTLSIPTDTSDLNNDSGFVDAAGAAAAAPVQSVNGQTGIVTLSIPAAPADYIIEQGASGSWSYRKWNSGKMEAWYVDDIYFPAPQDGPYNGFYRHVTTISMLSGFSSILMTLAQGQNSCMFICSAISTTSTVTLYLIHATSNTANIQVSNASIYVVGTWN